MLNPLRLLPVLICLVVADCPSSPIPIGAADAGCKCGSDVLPTSWYGQYPMTCETNGDSSSSFDIVTSPATTPVTCSDNCNLILNQKLVIANQIVFGANSNLTVVVTNTASTSGYIEANQITFAGTLTITVKKAELEAGWVYDFASVPTVPKGQYDPSAIAILDQASDGCSRKMTVTVNYRNHTSQTMTVNGDNIMFMSFDSVSSCTNSNTIIIVAVVLVVVFLLVGVLVVGRGLYKRRIALQEKKKWREQRHEIDADLNSGGIGPEIKPIDGPGRK